MFVNFFNEKAKKLSERTIREDENLSVEETNPNSQFIVTEKMVEEAVKQLKPKKSYGTDLIPLCVVTDCYIFLKRHYIRLMRMCTRKIPRAWKTARVLPIHKKGG